MTPRLTGRQFKAIRERCGYSAGEVAALFASNGQTVSTDRSIFRIEEKETVPLRFVACLRDSVGEDLFDQSVAELGIVAANGREPGEQAAQPRRTVRSRRRRSDSAGTARQPETVEESEAFFTDFLNSLPVHANTTMWNIAFRDALARLLGDVDKVVVNINYDCDLNNPGAYRVDMAVTEAVGVDGAEPSLPTVMSIGPDDVPSVRLLEVFRQNRYPMESFHPPYAVDCFLDGTAYAGTIFFWREQEKEPISEATIARIEKLRPFLIFVMTDAIARDQQARPLDRIFIDVLTIIIESARLTEQERKVVTLMLYGYPYEQMADRLYLAVDTIRKHVTSIYHKTGTHSRAELFAKYFTPRLGF